jgi:hypothetical protein
MKCAVHPEVDATGFCRNCGKAMCATCARPVREVLYCESCLATGMGMGMPASQPPAADPYQQPANAFVPPPAASLPLPGQAGRPSPAAAFVIGLFPGLGAVYNGEYNKAIVHLVIFIALILGIISAADADDVSGLAVTALSLLLAGFVFYMAFDAMRVAQARSVGQTIIDPLNEITKNLPLGPAILIGIGGFLLLSNFGVFRFLHLSLWRLWPLIFVGVGVLMFRNRTNRPQ